MSKHRLIALAGACLLAAPAFAADLPPEAPAPPNFAGFYLGGQIGYGWGATSGNVAGIWPLWTVPTSVSTSTQTQGVIGGAHVGYRWQIQNVVLGLEGDVNGTSLRKDTQPLYNIAYQAQTSSPVQGSVRGRLGYAFDRTLVYATGGAAFGWIQDKYNVLGSGNSFSSTKTGWTAGGGVEFAVDQHWSVRAEYRYTKFGYLNDGPIVYPTLFQSQSWSQNQVQVGFSYRWGPTAVVRKD